ncbi:MAG TPA: hypothetical protein VL547_05155 [Dinghuibacter sp.]|uniref:hypothetical protein n=1 Tax=Dinghuibacter sp. TaxID=2024697 RepID=UPI002C6C1C02|nr:hypothetical protein [Dinghuibacter sp.]HTJ11385.1 hypothetical protein [Dinghuibacter sp.]
MKYLLMVAVALTQETVFAQLRFKVVDDDNKGVKSVIVKIDGSGIQNNLGVTNDSGEFRIDPPCAGGDRLQARPQSPLLSASNITYCTDVHGMIKVYNVLYTNNLRQNALYYEYTGNYALSAYLNNTLATRYQGVDSLSALNYKVKAYNLTATSFRMTSAFKTAQGPDSTFLLSPEFESRLFRTQKKLGLQADGKLSDAMLLGLSNFSEEGAKLLYVVPHTIKMTNL